jgi:hypothetical protein
MRQLASAEKSAKILEVEEIMGEDEYILSTVARPLKPIKLVSIEPSRSAHCIIYRTGAGECWHLRMMLDLPSLDINFKLHGRSSRP